MTDDEMVVTIQNVRSYTFCPDLKHSLRRASARGPAWYSSPPMMDGTLSSSSTNTANSLSLFPSMLRSLMLADPATEVGSTDIYDLSFGKDSSEWVPLVRFLSKLYIYGSEMDFLTIKCCIMRYLYQNMHIIYCIILSDLHWTHTHTIYVSAKQMKLKDNKL